MSELSAAALAVEKDRLLEGGRTPAEVERMQRAAVLSDADIWSAVREAARVYGAREGMADYAMDVIDGAMKVVKNTGRFLLSPPETPAGVHAPQPQAPQTGTPTPVGISYVSPRHVCEGPREDCWCAALPGAGAG